jgi:2-dehydro-3-deoxyphosphooctonate aldolase (KDO 8-P synthase)
MPHPFHLGNVTIGGDDLFLIAGPCVIESERHARSLADAVQRIAADLHVPYIFKASYDKANRTSIRSFRGPGLVEGCRILREIGESNGVPVLTDVHTPEQCAEVSDALGPADLMLQIPAFLCRQTDLLAAAARTGRAVNIKKGQFVAPSDMRHAVQKVKETQQDLTRQTPEGRQTQGPPAGESSARISLTERGASFGYNNLVVDMRSLPILRAYAPVVFDATHSVQMPSSGAGARDSDAPGSDSSAPAVSGGQPEFIPVLARAAVAAGIDGLFLEVHDNPAQAKSDGANALRLDLLQPLLETLLAIRAAVQPRA